MYYQLIFTIHIHDPLDSQATSFSLSLNCLALIVLRMSAFQHNILATVKLLTLSPAQILNPNFTQADKRTSDHYHVCMPPTPLINSVGGIYLWSGPWVSEWVCASRKPYLINQWRECHPILIIDVFEVGALISFWGQRSRSQQAMTLKPGEYHRPYLRKYLS